MIKKGDPAGFGGKGPFCKVHAGARLFRAKKGASSRPRARLGESTEHIKKQGREPTVVLNSVLGLGSFGAAA